MCLHRHLEIGEGRIHGVILLWYSAEHCGPAPGFVDWWLAAIFIGGCVVGDIAGARAAGTRGRLNTAFAGIIIAVAIYMLVHSVGCL
jgi:uncharacterized membrane protein YfcA